MDAAGSTSPDSSDWIDHAMMEAALKRQFSCGDITVESISVEPATKPGAGYGSQVSRVRVAFRMAGLEGQAAQLVVKADSSTPQAQEQVGQWEIFEKETLVLAEVISPLHEALQRVEGASFRPVATTCLHHGATPRAFLVLDDLAAAGYRLADADRPLDFKHCEVVMRAYARLHAGTAHVLTKRPDYGAQLNTDFFSDEKTEFLLRQMMQCMFSAIADFLKRNPSYEHYAAKYASLTDALLPVMRKVLKKKVEDTKLKVLVHGDCWKNNMMFKYSAGEVADVRFVDFQLTHVSSPARDLVYFMFANASLEAIQRLPLLLETYHRQLQESLRSLGMVAAADAYPLEELLRDMEDLQPFALYASAFCGFVVSGDRVADKFSRGLRAFKLFPDTFFGTYDNKYAGPYVKYMTHFFDSKGLL